MNICNNFNREEERRRINKITTEASVSAQFCNLYLTFNFHSLFVSVSFQDWQCVKQEGPKAKGYKIADISVKRTGKPADSFVAFSWDFLPQSSMPLLSMCHKGRSTHKRRWTLMSLHTSGGISFPISICCRLSSTPLLLVGWNGFFYICTVKSNPQP